MIVRCFIFVSYTKQQNRGTSNGVGEQSVASVRDARHDGREVSQCKRTMGRKKKNGRREERTIK